MNVGDIYRYSGIAEFWQNTIWQVTHRKIDDKTNKITVLCLNLHSKQKNFSFTYDLYRDEFNFVKEVICTRCKAARIRISNETLGYATDCLCWSCKNG